MWLHASIQYLPDVIRYHARQAPDKVALIDQRKTYSYREMDLRSNQVANGLIQANARPGDVIGFLGKNSLAVFESLFGAGKAGCTFLPLNWRLTPAELAQVIDDAQPLIIFAEHECLAQLEAACKISQRSVRIEPFDVAAGLTSFCSGQGDIDPGVEVSPRDVALLIYTSGTTGKPKGVELTHQSISHMRLCEHLEPSYQWLASDILVMAMPNFHLLGLSVPIQALYSQATVTLMPALDVGKLLQMIAQDRPTMLVLAPTAIQMLLDHPDAKTTDFSSIRQVIYAGSAITAHLLKRAIKEMQCEFMQFYGATESGGAITILRPDQHDLVHEEKLKSCGTPLPLTEVSIVDANGQPCPDGEIGELLVRTPANFRGYRNQPEATAAALHDGWYRTGDAGYRASDGLLYLVDRVKDMIVTGGENVYSTEVEQALAKHPAVAMSAVVGLPDAHWGEMVSAVVVLKAGHQASEEELVKHCRQLIAGYKVPKRICFDNALPTSPAGKVLKRLLRDTLQSKLQSAA
ncbi:long-chain-fatty-acid--CoA ligase [Aquabacterium sp.]|uniref:long-chain-fatty-acid--CoA ligase n=1 Tax=Aquabacterium sp. TaxID=1872578 RepID=UPI0025BB6D26|nr:long-chain-fatty-acid--CoA ligase [Aquabacterium sp.]